MKIELLEYPTEKDWMEVKRRALVTVGHAVKSIVAAFVIICDKKYFNILVSFAEKFDLIT